LRIFFHEFPHVVFSQRNTKPQVEQREVQVGAPLAHPPRWQRFVCAGGWTKPEKFHTNLRAAYTKELRAYSGERDLFLATAATLSMSLFWSSGIIIRVEIRPVTTPPITRAGKAHICFETVARKPFACLSPTVFILNAIIRPPQLSQLADYLACIDE
jgi:hypothetical protein